MTYQRFGTPTTDTDSELVESEVTESEREERLHHEPNYDDRSLVFTGLSSATTLLDITTVVRGGAILNVFITTSGTTAHVSFVKSLAAHAFHQHAKRQDIYIKDKLVRIINLIGVLNLLTLLSSFRLPLIGVNSSHSSRLILHVKSK